MNEPKLRGYEVTQSRRIWGSLQIGGSYIHLWLRACALRLSVCFLFFLFVWLLFPLSFLFNFFSLFNNCPLFFFFKSNWYAHKLGTEREPNLQISSHYWVTFFFFDLQRYSIEIISSPQVVLFKRILNSDEVLIEVKWDEMPVETCTCLKHLIKGCSSLYDFVPVKPIS